MVSLLQDQTVKLQLAGTGNKEINHSPRVIYLQKSFQNLQLLRMNSLENPAVLIQERCRVEQLQHCKTAYEYLYVILVISHLFSMGNFSLATIHFRVLTMFEKAFSD